MSVLEVSQIIFNLTISLAVIVVAVLVSVIAWDIIKFMKSGKKFLEGISNLPFISRFFNKKKKKIK